MRRWIRVLGLGVTLLGCGTAAPLDPDAPPGPGDAPSGPDGPVGLVLCGGFLGLTCDEGSYCDFDPEDACGAADASGVCVPRPEICTLELAPVIGCDGHEYGNACAAHNAGTDDLIRVCDEHLQCPDDRYCDFTPDRCGDHDQSGLCEKRPQTCSAQHEPVTGCNSMTYENACEAARAGQDVKAP